MTAKPGHLRLREAKGEQNEKEWVAWWKHPIVEVILKAPVEAIAVFIVIVISHGHRVVLCVFTRTTQEPRGFGYWISKMEQVAHSRFKNNMATASKPQGDRRELKCIFHSRQFCPSLQQKLSLHMPGMVPKRMPSLQGFRLTYSTIQVRPGMRK